MASEGHARMWCVFGESVAMKKRGSALGESTRVQGRMVGAVGGRDARESQNGEWVGGGWRQPKA